MVRPAKLPPYTTWARKDGQLDSEVFRKHLILDRNAVNSSRRLDSPSPRVGRGLLSILCSLHIYSLIHSFNKQVLNLHDGTSLC